MHPVIIAIVAFFVFLFLTEKMPTLALAVLLVSWFLSVGWLLYRLQMLPGVIMDLIDKFTNRDALAAALDQSEKDVQRVDPVEFAKFVNARVIGQEAVINRIAKSVARRTSAKRIGKPIISVLISGPTGVGKTEMAKAMTEYLFGDVKSMFRIDVGNLGSHGASSLVGSPKGYAGSDQWGALTKHLKTQPHTLILFDEIEKAGRDPNSELYKILLSLLDEGRVTERSVNQTVDASGAIIMMTSNANAQQLGELAERYIDDPEELVRATKDSLQDYFAPELLARMDEVTTVKPLTSMEMASVILVNLNKFAERYELEIAQQGDGVAVELLVEAVRKQQTLKNYGVRELLRWLENKIVDHIIEARDEGAKTIRLTFDTMTEEPGVEIVELREIPDE